MLTQSLNNPDLLVWLAATGLMAIVGITAWMVQLLRGIGTTSLSDINAWGIYIAGFIFFVGLSAGSMVLASLPVLFNLPKFYPYAALSTFVALVSVIIGGLFIMADAGKPERLWHMIRFGRIASPLIWDVLLTTAYVIIIVVYLYSLMTGQSASVLKPLALVALLAGLADGITGFVFATQTAREFWYSALQPVNFILAALASAGALLLLFMVVLRYNGVVNIEYSELNSLAILTAVTLGLGLLLFVCEIIPMVFTSSDNTQKILKVMLASPMFWGEVISAVAAILILSLPGLRSIPIWSAAGAALALVHLVLKRIHFVHMGFAVPNITYSGAVITPTEPYRPSLLEVCFSTGMIGMFAFLLTLGFNNML